MPNLKELNLEDNYISALPPDLSIHFENIQNLNLNGNSFDETNVSVNNSRTHINSFFIVPLNRCFDKHHAQLKIIVH